jgi:hypothetical protein
MTTSERTTGQPLQAADRPHGDTLSAEILISLKAASNLQVWGTEGRDDHVIKGVTDKHEHAHQGLRDALAEMPGPARGTIQEARIDYLTTPIGYAYGTVITAGRRDRSGVVRINCTLCGRETITTTAQGGR